MKLSEEKECELKPTLVWAILLLFFFSHSANAQNQQLADSLASIYENEAFAPSEELNMLRKIANNHLDTERKLFYSDLLIQRAMDLDSIQYAYSGYLQKGNSLRLKGDLSKALENYIQGANIATQVNMAREQGLINVAIADVYSLTENHSKAVESYHIAINILKKEDDKQGHASALLNLGDEFFNYGKQDSALLYFNEAEKIFKSINSEDGEAYCLGNVGLVYAKKEQYEIAEEKISRAVELLEKHGDFYPICVYLTYMSDIYLEKGDNVAALKFAKQSLDLAQRYGLKKEVGKAFLKLSELQEKSGNHYESLHHLKKHISYKDSVNNLSSIQEIANIRTDYELSKKQIEVDLLSQQKKNQQIMAIAAIIGFILFGLLALSLYKRNKIIQESSLIISKEKQRSEELLLNILPEETANELKIYGKVKGQRFESVTVMFTDFIGFSKYSEGLSPESLVEIVDFYYSMFDEIINKYGLEKIKTIGDSYMCAGGLPFPTSNHAIKMIQAAFDISAFVEKAKHDNPFDREGLEIRLGINTGPVVAGVVGTKKFAYDIWGDAVNIAARMESSSATGKINVSANTYELIKDEYHCEYRGEVQVKSKGSMKMYFVENNSPDV